MHRYFPHTAEDEAQMLGVVGADRVEDLFASIPADCRHEGALPLTAMTEWELTAQAEALAASMPAAGSAWIGAGSYQHYIPAVVPVSYTHLIRWTASRSLRWKWRPTPNMSRMMPISAHWDAVSASATKPGE